MAAVLLLAFAGCSIQPTRNAAASGESPAPRAKAAAPVSPADVQVDEGTGFTVTEAVTIGSGVRATYREALQYLAEDDDQAGIDLLLAVIDEVPEATGPYIDLGIAYGRAGQLDEAVEALSSATAATPDHPVAHNELGIAYRRLGRFAEARASYQRALDIYPGFHYARRNLAVLCDLYLADADCALDNYEAYRTSVSDDPEVDMWIADLRNRVGAGQ